MSRNVFVAVGALLLCLSAAADVWYVDKDNEEGPWDGRSWATAFHEVQPAIDAAYAAGGGEIWVTRDYYDETRTSIVHAPPYDLNTGSLVMREGVHLYGGFEGDETARSQRLLVGRTSIKRYGMTDVIGHVVVGADNSTLDGFTIRGGRAWRYGENNRDDPRFHGGGMYNDGVSPVVRNCVFKENLAFAGGGGMKNTRGACPAILDCVFEDNECDLGAGIDNEENASPTITGCRFVRNYADWGCGGGIFNRHGSSPTVTDCTFEGNVAGTAGGMENYDDCATVLEDCVFLENVAQGGGYGGGAIANTRESTLVARRCRFIRNVHYDEGPRSEDYAGGAVRNSDRSSAVFTNCVFFANRSWGGGAVCNVGYSTARLAHCTLVENLATYSRGGQGIRNMDRGALTVTNCILWDYAGVPTTSENGVISAEIFDWSYSDEVVVEYCIVRGGYPGEGNIDAEPEFVDAEAGDLRLRTGSPGVDTGENDDTPATDLDGIPRPQGAGVDMGAYEFPTADVDGDGIPDLYEGDGDRDEDGSPNYLDPDSDGDGVSDAAEGLGDPDGDGVPAYLDWDSDGDSLGDVVEGAEDTDGDGAINSQDLDSDGDGFWDSYEGFSDPDGDGLWGYLDRDNDDDGIDDADEPVIFYVDKDNDSGVENGAWWEVAFREIQPAIDAGHETGNAEIWVAEGVYDEYRTSRGVHPWPYSGDTRSILMREGVHLFGGFAGGETERGQRDWVTHVTVLHAPSVGSLTAAHVVVGADNATLDGVVVTGGQYDSEYDWSGGRKFGAGMYNESVSPTVRNCTFSDNHAAGGGGGMANLFGACPTLSNCLFTGNSVQDSAAGLYNAHDSSPRLSHCSFIGSSGDAGALTNDSGSSPVLEACELVGDDQGSGNASMGIGSYCSPLFKNCIIWNSSSEHGATIGCASYSTPTFVNCTISGGAGWWALKAGRGARVSFANCIVWHENSTGKPIFYLDETAELIITHSDILGGYPGEGNIDVDPGFVDVSGGNLRLRPWSACLDAGTDFDAPDFDIIDVPRPLGAGIDMGAYELTDAERMVDTDGDGILDVVETGDDPDEDGIASFLDDDSDGDGILDSTEGDDDPDGDGIPSFIDRDTDGDGLLDSFEGQDDGDEDGRPSYRDLDSDGDGVADRAVWFVDKANKSGAGDGLTWEAAFATLQEAIERASVNEGGEVWVAEGVYDEARTSIVHPAPDDQNTGSLVLRQNIDLYGGFSGDESERKERDWEEHITTIDGSTARDGQPAYHVVVGADNAVLDGFTVTGGAGGGTENQRFGGGMYNEGCSPRVADCAFIGNSGVWGGAMYNTEASPFIANCTFINNFGNYGAAMHNFYASPRITDCVFEDNLAGTGGGIFDMESSSSITFCSFLRNAATYSGGVLLSGSSGALANCLFIENRAVKGGGLETWAATSRVSNCIFERNVADAVGGGVYHSGYNVVLNGCVFRENAADLGGGAYVSLSSDLPLRNCVLSGNTATKGAAVYVTLESSASAVNCTFARNLCEEQGAIAYLYSEATLDMTNCILWDIVGEPFWSSPGDPGPAITYCDVQGGWEGEGNIDADPLFVDPDGGDFRLGSGSPCIDVGTTEGASSIDLNGILRPCGAGVDMGAYETGGLLPYDPNQDGAVNAMDVQVVINAALGLDTTLNCDLDDDGSVGAVDTQFMINRVLGM